MVDNNTIMMNGICTECGALENDGLSCYEQFGYPLVWEQSDLQLYKLHFWLVSCYMLQHPSNFSEAGYTYLIELFIEAYDNNLSISDILKRNTELLVGTSKISNPISNDKRLRNLIKWSMTIEDIYLGGEINAIENLNKWKKIMRDELKKGTKNEQRKTPYSNTSKRNN